MEHNVAVPGLVLIRRLRRSLLAFGQVLLECVPLKVPFQVMTSPTEPGLHCLRQFSHLPQASVYLSDESHSINVNRAQPALNLP